MVARQFATSVGTGATKIDGTEYRGFLLRNTDASATVYVGDSTVTTATGFPILAGEIFSPSELTQLSLSIGGAPADPLYGVVASGTVDVRVLLQGVAQDRV